MGEKIDYNNLNNIQMDVLREIGNIGTGHATTALSSMINKKINMDTPIVKIIDFNEIADIIGGEERQVAAILLNISSVKATESSDIFTNTSSPNNL